MQNSWTWRFKGRFYVILMCWESGSGVINWAESSLRKWMQTWLGFGGLARVFLMRKETTWKTNRRTKQLLSKKKKKRKEKRIWKKQSLLHSTRVIFTLKNIIQRGYTHNYVYRRLKKKWIFKTHFVFSCFTVYVKKKNILVFSFWWFSYVSDRLPRQAPYPHFPVNEDSCITQIQSSKEMTRAFILFYMQPHWPKLKWNFNVTKVLPGVQVF